MALCLSPVRSAHSLLDFVHRALLLNRFLQYRPDSGETFKQLMPVPFLIIQVSGTVLFGAFSLSGWT
jgi:hypothetical protein